MDGYIVGSMISANSITGEQIQANSIKTANLELSVQKKIQDATNEETVKALIKADLDGFESTLSKEFVTVENAATQIQQATEVAVKEATQNIIDNAVSESMGAVDGQLNDKLNQYTSGTLLPAIAEKAEEVLQNAEDYVVTQLESYATKQELSSSISQTREQIELSVSEKYTTKAESATIITEAIDGITVGAINRVFGTGENKSFKFNGGANETWLPYKFSNDISDKEVFVSFKYTLTGTAQNGSQIEFAPSYLKKANNQTVYRPKHVFFTSNRLQDVNITDTVSFTTKDFQDISPSSTSYIRFVGNGFTGTLSISEVQIKPGNSKTTWSPAPEDTITDITNAKNEAINSANGTLIATISNYYTKSETDSAISVAKDEINLGVSNKYETKANVETKVTSTLNSAKSYADTKKTEAINSANSTLSTTIQNYYTKTETDSQINVAKNAITQSVSNTYATKTDVTSSINGVNSSISSLTTRISSAESKITDTAITNTVKKNFYTKTETENAITSKGYATTSQLQQTEQEFIYKFSQQGAVNLIYNGSPALDHSECWEAVLSEFTSASQNGVLAVKVDSQNHGYAYNRIINVMPNVKYSIQYEVYPEVNTNGCGVWLIGYQDEQATSNNWSVKLGHHQPINAWHKNQITVTIPADVSRIQIRIDHLGIVDGNNQTARAVFFTKFQVREGDSFYPEWSPNPNETYNAVTKITPEGMSIYDGKIEILNQQSKKVFWVDNTGQLCTDNIYIFGDERAGNIDIRGTGNKGIGIRSLDAGDRYIDFTTLPIGESFEDYQNSGTFTRLLAKEGNFYILPTKELLIHSIRRDTNYLEKVTVVANQTNVTGNLIVENAVQTPNVITNLIRPIDGYETISIRGNVDGINLLKVEDVFRTATLYHRDGNGERDIYVGSNLNMNRLHVINAKLLNCEIINTYSKEYDTILSEGYGTLDETTNTVALDCFKSTEQLIKENLELRERQLEHDELIVNTAFELAKLQLEVTVGV